MNNDARDNAAGRAPARTMLAWSVHAFTALGLVIAAAIAVLIFRGDTQSFRWAFAFMLLATIVDAVDGTLARWVGVKELLPQFDGARLDDIIDFQTYTSLPLLLIWRAELLPGAWSWFLLAPLVASAYGFCQTAAKTPDGFFLGFPSYWNLVAFYLYILSPPLWGSVTLILTLSVLTFVPSFYLYPSRRGSLNRLTNVLALVWIGLSLGVLFGWPEEQAEAGTVNRLRWTAILSLFFPIYYMAASWFITLRRWLGSAASVSKGGSGRL